MEKRIIIIDGNSLINRAYYAMQRPMITKEGLYTQGVYGFINMLSKIQKDHPAGYIAVAFDLKAPTFRHKEYAEYKAGRKKMPPELAMQLPLIKEVLGAMNIKMLEMEGFEADDIIGTVAKIAESEGLEPLIITGDKDELQLATQVTKVIITKKGISQFEIYDHDAMVEKYGFTPTQFIDFKGLMGDSSDNIPGLPGVGEKTAQKLILEYGSVENLLANVEDLKGKLKATVEENPQLALMSKSLATIDTNVPIDFNINEYRWEEADEEALIDVYVKLEFNSFLKKMNVKVKGSESTYKEEKILEETFENLNQFREELSKEGQLVINVRGDNNHKALPKIYDIKALVNHKLYYVDNPSEEFIKAFINLLKEENPKIIGHDLKVMYYMLMCYGMESFNTYFDTAIAQYVLDSGRSNYELSVLAKEYFHESTVEEKEAGQVSLFENSKKEELESFKKELSLVRQLSELLKGRLKEEDLEDVFYNIETPLIEVMAYMEYIGFNVDRNELESIGVTLKDKINEATNAIYEMAGEEFNINSPAQLGKILFEKLELPTGKKTKRGYSTNAETLEAIRDSHDIVPVILEYRTLTKLNGTYVEGLLPLIHKDGKIHAHFNQTVTTTGRISSSDPNMQNIPIKQELGRTVRKVFIPWSEEYTLMGADYSQIELRVLAHMSEDTLLIEAFNNGEDIHKATAARVLGVKEDAITLEQRSRAKAVNFGVIYGMSGFGLSSELHITRKEAESYIKNYFEKHEKVKEFMDMQVNMAKEKGFVRTIVGRKRIIHEINGANYMVRQLGERLAMNSPIQGSAADIIKIAMIKVYERLKGFKSKLILQVHDELLINVHKDEIQAVKEILTDSMESAMDLKVKLAIDLNTGNNWYNLK